MGLDSVELILEAEEAFGISLADDEMVKTLTVGQFYEAIMRELPSPEKKFCLSAEVADHDRNEVWESVRILVADQLGVELEKITKESRFVADLGMS